jgi:hypothetical protein
MPSSGSHFFNTLDAGQLLVPSGPSELGNAWRKGNRYFTPRRALKQERKRAAVDEQA